MMGSEKHCVSCTTFNILAPIYKRLNDKDEDSRESQYRASWLNRNQEIIDRLLGDRSSIICLQEVWLENDELVNMYEKRLGDAGYISFKLARTNNRGDGLLTAIHRDYFKVVNHRELFFNDFGDRVAQLLHVESVFPLCQGLNNGIRQQVLIVNTHLLYPHDSSFCIIRLQQVYKILQAIEMYQKEHSICFVPILLCGDWNGSKKGHVYKFLRSQGFVSSFDTACQYRDNDVDAQNWVSHRNHFGNICGVDFIWLLNPDNYRKPLKTSWNESVFGIIKYLLQAASLSENNAFSFLKADCSGDHITYSGFCRALSQLGVTGHPHGLSSDDIKDLWLQADIDQNGVIDFEEFQHQIWSPKWSQQIDNRVDQEAERKMKMGSRRFQAFGFDVKDAVLFPPEVEKGLWPENYVLSDHAPLTVVLCPVGVPRYQPAL